MNKFDFLEEIELEMKFYKNLIGNEYHGPMDRVAEIFQNEFGLTTYSDLKPVLATYGLMNCVSIGGYEPELKIGFLTHYQDNTNLDNSFGYLLYQISRLTKDRNSLFKTKISGGISGMSERLVNELRRKLEISLRPDIKFEIIGEDVLGHGVKGRDLVLDTCSGKFYDEYNPLTNPYRREPYPDNIKETIFRSKIPRLVYFPKDFE